MDGECRWFRKSGFKPYPEVYFRKGYFQSESPIDFTIGGVVHIKADSSVEEFKESDFKSDYVQELLVGKKNILIKMPSGNQQIVLSQFKIGS